MPESLEMPAPVSTAIRRPASSAISAGALVSAIFTSSRLGGRSDSVEAILGSDQLGVHVLLHHPQSRGAQISVDMRDSVRGNQHLEVTHKCVQGAVEDALLGNLPGEDDPLGAKPVQQVFQRCGVE